MKTLRICLLWHMHQPYYTDPVAGSASMPWVRLHATKAYFDMAFLAERFPTVKITFNLTPSLLIQLKELASGSVQDLFLEHTKRPASDLTQVERAFLLRHFFAANWVTMVRPYPRYHELLLKRGTDVKGKDLERLARQFTTQELLDLQVWHNLAWFGYGMAACYPRVNALRAKDRGFTEEDKQEVLALQHRAITEIIPRYRRLAQAGQIELTTSPFYHPILPLLIDTDIARRSLPETPLPRRFQAPADAEAQIQKAVALHTELFGAPPLGLWPSEGSVCPEMIPILRRAGLRWIATDEDVLARSLRDWHREAALYQPYAVGVPGDQMAVLFRDRRVSDAVGFVYSRSTAEAATEDLVHRINGIAQQAPGDYLLIPIILDGENPWEHYHDGGEGFLSGLYGRLADGSARWGDGLHVIADTISRALDSMPPVATLEHLHSGSWINANFKIWLGHPEDNRAWDLLRETRARLVEMDRTVPLDRTRGAWEELYAAEGSDWWWWFGDDFETDYREEFDRLFRAHLRNVFTRAGVPAPLFLNEPLVRVREPDATREPTGLLLPTIDGLVSDFFEWRGAGAINPAPPLGAMWKASPLFTYIGFGFSLDALFLRLDPSEGTMADQSNLEAELLLEAADSAHKLVFLLGGPELSSFTLYAASPGQDYAEVNRYHTICRRKVIELAAPFKDLHLQAGQEFKLTVVVRQNGLEVDRYPRYHPVTLTVPDRDFEARLWKV